MPSAMIPQRSYRIDDADMIRSAKLFHGLLLDDLADFVNFDLEFASPFAADFNDLIDSAGFQKYMLPHREEKKENLSVTGLVKNASGNPVAGVKARIASKNIETTTAADGAFAIGKLSAGTYELVFEKAGLQTQSVQVAVEKGKVKELVVVMQV